MLAAGLMQSSFPAACAAGAAVQPSTPTPAADNTERQNLEIAKLKLEVAKLDDELGSLTSKVLRWLGALGPLLVGVVLAILGFWFDKRLNRLQNTQAEQLEAEERQQARFAALAEDRASVYACAFEALKPAALFFPPTDGAEGRLQSNAAGGVPMQQRFAQPKSDKSPQLARTDCEMMGEQLSSWYFGKGGLMMTTDSRNAYFSLMEALRRAAIAPDELASQTVGEHRDVISEKLVDGYRDELAKKYPVFQELKDKTPDQRIDAGDWQFGPSGTASGNAERFKDFVLIQKLASRFRTTLTNDIGSRKAPVSVTD